MAAIKTDSVQEAREWVEDRQRDLAACMDYRQIATYREWLLEAQEELAYQIAVNG